MALNDISPKLNMEDSLLNIKLKNHQRALLYKTIEVDQNCCGSKFPFALMSDKTGSGKTYVVLALIFYLIVYFNSKGPNIIVVPHNIYSQWIISIKTLLGKQLKCKYLTEYKEISELYTNKQMIYNYDIILTTSIHYNAFATILQSLQMNVQRIFFDEADTIKDLLVNCIPTNMTWFISATIERVFDPITNNAKIGKYKLNLNNLLYNNCYCDSDFINKNINLPKPIEEKFKCHNFYIDNVICNIIPEYMKNINAYDYTTCKKECDILNIKNESDIIKGLYNYCIKTIESYNLSINDCEKKMKYCKDYKDKNNYELMLSKYKQEMLIYKNRLNIINSLCNQHAICIKCFKRCIEEFAKIGTYHDITTYTYECGHYICINCMKEIELNNNGIQYDKINIKCDKCNENHMYSSYKIKTINLPQKYIKSFNKEKFDKNYVLEQLLKICNDKIIIYCENANISLHIKKITDKLNIEFEELNGGNYTKIDEILTKFKDDDNIKILIIDNARMTIGMNLEFVNNIIIYSKISENIKKQLIGRSNRFPRTEKLYIFNLLYDNEK